MPEVPLGAQRVPAIPAVAAAVTLVITLLRPEGVFQLVDFRLTLNGQPVDDATPKQLDLHGPSMNDVPRTLLAFTGLAEIVDGTPMLQWIRETLRGESWNRQLEMFDHLRAT